MFFHPSERLELPKSYDGHVYHNCLVATWWSVVNQTCHFGKLTPIRINSKARPAVGEGIYNLSKKHLGHKLVT